MNPLDIIGDIHGQFLKLIGLLEALGYRHEGATWKHPAGRRVVFLGDYIDRGPKVRDVLTTVRGMCEAGDARAIMGNHEFNAILQSLPDRQQAGSMDRGHGLQETLDQFAGRETEWSEWVDWMRRLPLFLDLGGLRAVHACWDQAAIDSLGNRSLADDAFLHECAQRKSPEQLAVTRLLNGPELAVPDGALVLNPKGMPLAQVRVRWWNLPSRQVDICDLALPMTLDGRGMLSPEQLKGLPNYASDAPPVFFGHIWLPADHAKTPLAPNVACLDFSVARGGPLVAYLWDGEQTLTADKFFSAPI